MQNLYPFKKLCKEFHLTNLFLKETYFYFYNFPVNLLRFKEQNLFHGKRFLNFSKFVINLVFLFKILDFIFTIISSNLHFLIQKFLVDYLKYVLNELNLKLKITVGPFAKK